MLPSSGTITSAQIAAEVSAVVTPGFSITHAPIMSTLVNKAKPWNFPVDLYNKAIKYTFTNKQSITSGGYAGYYMTATMPSFPSLDRTDTYIQLFGMYSSTLKLYDVYITHSYMGSSGVTWKIADSSHIYVIDLTSQSRDFGFNYHHAATQGIDGSFVAVLAKLIINNSAPLVFHLYKA